jgi:hypothetical protein
MRRHVIVYRTLAVERRNVVSETVDDWKMLQEIKEYDICDICNGDETNLFFNQQV